VSASFGQCWAAATAAADAPLGREAIDAARPRGLFGVLRGRGPVAVQVYVADRDGRVVWQHGQAFALIEPPAAEPGPLLSGGLPLIAARVLDRHWDVTLFAVPPVLLLAAGVAAMPQRQALLVVVLALLAVLYVAVLMTCFVVRSLLRTYQSGRAGRDPYRRAEERMRGGYWHLSLCHQPLDQRTEELLTVVTGRLVELVSARVRGKAAEAGGLVGDIRVTERLVCVLRSAITTRMRTTLVEATGSARRPDERSRVVILTQPAGWPEVRRDPLDTGSFIVWFLTGVGAITAVLGAVTGDRQRVGYGAAVRWLLLNLVWSGPPELTAGSGVWVIGALYRLLGLTGIGVGVTAGYRFVTWQRAQTPISEGERAIMPQVLIMVAKELERDAVMAAVKAVNDTQHRLDFAGDRGVFFLGDIGGVRIMLAQSAEPGAANPNGMLMSASEITRFYRPRYLILTGVCYGLREDRQQIGDVLVSVRVIDIDHRSDVDGVVRIRGVNVPPSTRLLSRLQASTAGEPAATAADQFDVHFGPMLSSTTLVNSPSGRAQIKDLAPNALGGDMESVAVYTAAAAHDAEWIVVKGISDFAQRKTHDHQPRAAANAAAQIVRMLQIGRLGEIGESVER